jgi:NDP-sugar pyrophosphorylase family protein
LIGYTLALLARHGVTEVLVNVHHLPDILMEAASRHCPANLTLRFSFEDPILGTGGGIRRAAEFLRESDPCLVLGGDMLLDVDLSQLIDAHRAHRAGISMLLRAGDPRAPLFGTIGVDAKGLLRRIGDRFAWGEETRSGIYTWVNVLSARCFDTLPEREVFSHLDDWIAPLLAAGAEDILAEVAECDDFVWEPVGTLAEYVAVNLDLPPLSYAAAIAPAQRAGARCEGDLVIGAGAVLSAGARLRRAVIWEDERVEGLRASDGVFAAGRFHSCNAPSDTASSPANSSDGFDE